jgi:hypothetical protein
MIQITLRTLLDRRMLPSEYDQNLINFEEGGDPILTENNLNLILE